MNKKEEESLQNDKRLMQQLSRRMTAKATKEMSKSKLAEKITKPQDRLQRRSSSIKRLQSNPLSETDFDLLQQSDLNQNGGTSSEKNLAQNKKKLSQKTVNDYEQKERSEKKRRRDFEKSAFQSSSSMGSGSSSLDRSEPKIIKEGDGNVDQAQGNSLDQMALQDDETLEQFVQQAQSMFTKLIQTVETIETEIKDIMIKQEE